MGRWGFKWGSDDLTVFVVMKFANATRNATEVVCGHYQSTTERQWWFAALGSATYIGDWRMDSDGQGATGNAGSQTGNNFKHTDYKVHSWTTNGTGTVTLYTDGVSKSLTTTTTGGYSIYDLSSSFEVGAAFSASTPIGLLQGSISEIIVTTDAASAATRAAIENYLNKKYDLY